MFGCVPGVSRGQRVAGAAGVLADTARRPARQGKESVKKADVSAAAARADVPMTDAIYTRVIKELCDSRGSAWHLKTGM